MTNASLPPSEWRNFTTRQPIAALRLKREGLRQLYRIVHSKQLEYRDRMVAGLSKMDNESPEQFEVRRAHVVGAFPTSITVTGLNDEMVHGNNETLFESVSLPDQIKSILINTDNVPKAVLGFQPSCKIVIFLDFSRPPSIDFSRLPTLPTPNDSNFEIMADNESWFSASHASLAKFFATRKTSVDWLHRAAVYDVLLFFVGFPAALWTSYRIGGLVSANKLHPFLASLIYFYIFMSTVACFRLMFSYSRWVFPKVEVYEEGASALRHRAFWGVVFLGVITAFIYDTMKAVF